MLATPSTEAIAVQDDPDFAGQFLKYMAEHPEVFDDPTWEHAEEYLFALITGGAQFYTDESRGSAVWFTEIIANGSARGHVVCWNPELYGHDETFRSAVRQVMIQFNLERVYFQIPSWLSAPVNAIRRLPWITCEGYLRHVFIKDDQWEDAWLFSVLRHEV